MNDWRSIDDWKDIPDGNTLLWLVSEGVLSIGYLKSVSHSYNNNHKGVYITFTNLINRKPYDSMLHYTIHNVSHWMIFPKENIPELPL